MSNDRSIGGKTFRLREAESNADCGYFEGPPLMRREASNQTWSMDFVMGALACSQRIKCLTIVDDFSNECSGDQDRPGPRVHQQGFGPMGLCQPGTVKADSAWKSDPNWLY